MKLGIVVPYSFSFWGGVVEHAQEQALTLMKRGHDVRLLIGHDPPGRVSRLLHPTSGRFEPPPPHVIPLGRSVITPANHSLANIVLSPSTVPRLRRVLADERFDLLHVHEPMTPAIGTAALALAETPVVATFHAAGPSRWRGPAAGLWGFLLDRIDTRIAVSEAAAETARSYSPGAYTVIPNGVRLPQEIEIARPAKQIVFVGRHESRKGLAVLLRAWPEVRRATAARLRLIGADPPAVRHLMRRERLSEDGVDLLGVVPADVLDRELRTARLLVAPSLGRESFGMVLTRSFATGTPVVASDIDGYRQVVTEDAGRLVRPGDPGLLAAAVVELLEDEDARAVCAVAARRLAEREYNWDRIGTILERLYGELLDEDGPAPAEARRLSSFQGSIGGNGQR